MWDLATGKEACVLRHQGLVTHAAFSPDGKKVITASNDGTAQVWQAVSGEPITPSLKLGVAVHYVAFSPDGRRVIAAGGDKYGTMDAGSPGTTIPGAMQEVVIPQGPGRPPIRYYVPGPAVYMPGRMPRNPRGLAQVWDIQSGKPAGIKPLRLTGWMNQAVFSPDRASSLVVTAGASGTASSMSKGDVRLWDGQTGALVKQVMHPFEVTSVAFSPDGRRVVAAGGQATHGRGEARVWDAASGEFIGRPLERCVPESGWAIGGHRRAGG